MKLLLLITKILILLEEGSLMVIRCRWVNNDEKMRKYHDLEWGVPVHDDQILYEFLILEGAQAGLSWNTILQKRENFRKAFDNFDYKKIARYNEKKTEGSAFIYPLRKPLNLEESTITVLLLFLQTGLPI